MSYRDYFEINRFVDEKYPKLPVVAATEPILNNYVFPPIMEVTTSFPGGGHTLIHSQTTPEQNEILRRLRGVDDIPPYAEKLGYQAIVWGPWEERIWGARVRERFTSPRNLLFQSGNVSLYRLEDNLLRAFRSGEISFPAWKNEAEYYRTIATFLYKNGWHREALDNFQEALKREPNSLETLIPLSKALVAHRSYADALQVMDRILTLDPQNSEVFERREKVRHRIVLKVPIVLSSKFDGGYYNPDP